MDTVVNEILWRERIVIYLPMNDVILVDENDRELGQLEKLAAHTSPILHRAFSVYLYNNRRELLLQQRAMCKYHTPGLWTNTCCSHPAPGEATVAAAVRRLKEELGIAYREENLRELPSLIYKHSFENGLHEYEYDHIFIGEFNGTPVLNTSECMDCRWVSIPELTADIEKNRDRYTPWLVLSVDRVAKVLRC